MSERILLAVDESPASIRAIDYVASILAGETAHFVHLIHVLPAGASASPDSEEHGAARELLASMKQRLVAAGLSEERVDAGVLSAPPKGDLVDGMLDLARDQLCGTIVVGRTPLPWFREQFHAHPADELIKRAQGFSFWIVE